MRAVHRTAIGAGFGALAVATVAAGASYACTPSQQIFISAAHGPVGTPVNVQGFGFEPQAEMDVVWNGVDGPVLGSAFVSPVATVGAGRPQAEVTVMIPEVAPATYTIVGVQKADGVVVRRAVTTFTVVPPAGTVVEPPLVQPVPPVVSVPPEAPGTPQAPVAPSEPTNPPVQPTNPLVQPPKPSAAPSTPPAPATAAPGPSAVVGSEPAPVAGRPTAATKPNAAIPAGDRRPAGAGAAPAAAATTPANAPVPAADDLWSGIEARGSAGLLNPSAHVGRDGTRPLGAVLLGFGILTLAGIALSTARARLAVVRASVSSR